jgi:uncharacterized protein DUF4384
MDTYNRLETNMKMLKKWVCVILLIFVFSASGFAASRNLNTAAKQMVAGLGGKLEKSNLDVSIGNLTLIDSQFSSEFAKNFLIYLESEMISHPDFSNVKPQQVLKTRGFAAMDDDEEEDEEGPSQVTMAGKYRIQGDLVYVSIFLLDKNGSRVAEHEVAIEQSAIPWKLSPPNMGSLKATEKAINTVRKPNNAFQIALTLDKGNSAVYTEGDELKIFFRTERDCYLKALYIDVNQNRILMYPTARDSKGKLRAGVDHALHANNKFTIQPPFGTEMIIAICSTQPLSSSNEINMGGGFSGYDSNTSTTSVISGLRGLAVSSQQSGPPQQAEARAYLTTVSGSAVCNSRGVGVSSQYCP